MSAVAAELDVRDTVVDAGLLADVERIVSRYLRGGGVAAGRVYTAFPAGAGNEPLVVITRIGGNPLFTRPLVFEQASLQLDVYGGPKKAAQVLARTVQSALAQLGGVHDDGVHAAVVTAELGAFRYVPDESFTPARPRYVLDVVVNNKAAGAV